MQKMMRSEFAGLGNGRKGAAASGRGGFLTASFTEARLDRFIRERIPDPKPDRKPLGSTVCPVCQAVFKDGHWQWLEFWPLDSPREICPACERIRDNYPAGLVTLSGDFIKSHRAEVVNLVRHHEQGERARHPLHRIISIEERPDTVVVATTDVHLPKRIGQALHRAYKGTLDLHYDLAGGFVRARWISHEHKDHKTTAKKRR